MRHGEVFSYADEFNIGWHPTLRAMGSPVGRQVMIPTPMQPTRRDGLGAAGWHTGEAVVLTRRRKRRREVAELLEALLAKHPRERVIVAWDNASTHQDQEVEAVLHRSNHPRSHPRHLQAQHAPTLVAPPPQRRRDPRHPRPFPVLARHVPV